MMSVIERLVAAMNDHDADRAAALMAPDYSSEQPAHPGREFVGRDRMRAHWEAMFAGIPNFSAELLRSTADGDTLWTEWTWTGTRSDSLPLDVRGVALFRTDGDQIVAGRLYMEDVAAEREDIEAAVVRLSGHRPNRASAGRAAE